MDFTLVSAWIIGNDVSSSIYCFPKYQLAEAITLLLYNNYF